MLLIVDDNPFFTDVINRILKKRSFSYDIVDSGLEALRRILVRGQEYALVLVDYRLPDVSGLEIVQTIRLIGDAEKANVPVVLMCAASALPALAEIRLSGFSGILYKPFLIKDLLDTIRQNCRFPVEGNMDVSEEEQDVIDDGEEKIKGDD